MHVLHPSLPSVYTCHLSVALTPLLSFLYNTPTHSASKRSLRAAFDWEAHRAANPSLITDQVRRAVASAALEACCSARDTYNDNAQLYATIGACLCAFVCCCVLVRMLLCVCVLGTDLNSKLADMLTSPCMPSLALPRSSLRVPFSPFLPPPTVPFPLPNCQRSPWRLPGLLHLPRT